TSKTRMNSLAWNKRRFRRSFARHARLNGLEAIMKRFVLTALGMLTVLGALLTHVRPADACGPARVDDVDFDQPRDQVSLLFAEADRLDAQARQMDVTAVSMERNSELLAVRARELRSQAVARGELDRARLLAQADQVSAQAAVARANAQQKRAQAS